MDHPHIAKNAQLKTAIPAEERLALILLFSASGDSYKSLQCLFKISPELILEIVPEVCTVLFEKLQNILKIFSKYSTEIKKNRCDETEIILVSKNIINDII